MPDLTALPLSYVLALFVMSAAVVGTAGVWMVTTTDRLADRTGLGEAIAGAVFLGVATSLSGTITPSPRQRTASPTWRSVMP